MRTSTNIPELQYFSMNKKERQFVEMVWQYYCAEGRQELPWRKTHDPYRILVSEMMLQQTQVERVVPKYLEFLQLFPTARRLTTAPLGDVIRAWQGLGYNRRAKYLQLAAREVVENQKGKWPQDEPGLRSLPGVGSYTAGAIMAFAYNVPTVLIETNVRQVFIHHFFKRATKVHDVDILKLVERTLPRESAREWYYALMDYGSYLKEQHGNITHKSKHYTKQSKFHGSDRQIRGAILKVFTKTENPLTPQQLRAKLAETDPQLGGENESGRVATQLARLTEEGFLIKHRCNYRLA